MNQLFKEVNDQIDGFDFDTIDSDAIILGVVRIRTPKKMGLECPTPQILVYLVTCNWRSSYVNFFNTAVSAHQKPIFTSECTATVWRPGSQLSHTPLAGFKWRAAGPLERKRKKERRVDKRERKREKDLKRNLIRDRGWGRKGGKDRGWGSREEGRRDRGREGGREGGRMDTPNFEMWLRPGL